jgi:hypothetical protein
VEYKRIKFRRKGLQLMELTLKQQQGLNVALSRYKNHEKYVVISGYA